MRVELTTGMVGQNQVWECGESVELPEAEALRFIESGMAIPVSQEKETATQDREQLKSKREKRGK